MPEIDNRESVESDKESHKSNHEPKCKPATPPQPQDDMEADDWEAAHNEEQDTHSVDQDNQNSDQGDPEKERLV